MHSYSLRFHVRILGCWINTHLMRLTENERSTFVVVLATKLQVLSGQKHHVNDAAPKPSFVQVR